MWPLFYGKSREISMKIDQRASDTTDNKSEFLNDEAYYKEIVDSLTELICRFNSNNNLIFVNGAFCNYFHLKRKDIIGQSFMDVIPEEDREFFSSAFVIFGPQKPGSNGRKSCDFAES